MADYELTAAQDEAKRRRTTTRSFFPAANNALATGARSTPYGGGSGNYGFGPNSGLVSPENNPAYQAAIAGGRPARTGFTTIQTPSGGSISVSKGSERKYTDLLYNRNPIADTGFQRPNPQAAYALGNTGAVPTGNTPYEQSFRMGANIENPVQQPQGAGLGYRIGQLATNAALAAVQNFQQSGQFNLQPTRPRRYFDPTSNYNF